MLYCDDPAPPDLCHRGERPASTLTQIGDPQSDMEAGWALALDIIQLCAVIDGDPPLVGQQGAAA